MAFQLSPGVQVQETDLTNIIPAVATSIGAYAGRFQWGPVEQAALVSSERNLVSTFGNPQSTGSFNNQRDWFTAANFLQYSNALRLVRVVNDSTARNAASEADSEGGISYTLTLTNTIDSDINLVVGPTSGRGAAAKRRTVNLVAGDSEGTIPAKVAAELSTLPGVTATAVGTVISVEASQEFDQAAYAQDYTLNFSAGGVASTATVSLALTATGTEVNRALIKNAEHYSTQAGSLQSGKYYARYPGARGNNLGILLVDGNINDSDFRAPVNIGEGNTLASTLSELFEGRPGRSVWAATNGVGNATNTDEIHVVVFDRTGGINGSIGEVLETFAYLSKVKDAKTADNAGNFYRDVVNRSSNWIFIDDVEDSTWGQPLLTATGATKTTIAALPSGDVAGRAQYNLKNGDDGAALVDKDYIRGFTLFNDAEALDVNLLLTGATTKVVQKEVIEIAEARKDAVAFVSPSYEAAVNNPTADKVVDYFNTTDPFNSSSYAMFDSGWKYQYDRYNDEFFWVPLNADVAGVTARTDFTNDPWFSPAGLNRGFIRDVVRLSFNPIQAQRDELYKQRINPVVTFRGQGTLLFGDKTALSRPSAFDRINVRRLFIVLEKAIATAAQFQLFEFNDEFTRANFVAQVEPFIQDVQSRRGLTDFRVVCDTTNNTPAVIDSNRFVADIYIKPNRSINFITLNFVAVRSGVSFTEVAGS